MVKVWVGPSQVIPALLKCGVTTMVAKTGVVPGFDTTNAGMFPVPVAARPMPVPELTQVYVVVPPVLFVIKMTGIVRAPVHNTWSGGSVTWPVGFTVMVKVWGWPGQLTPVPEK